jgi:hypothetical protein
MNPRAPIGPAFAQSAWFVGCRSQPVWRRSSGSHALCHYGRRQEAARFHGAAARRAARRRPARPGSGRAAAAECLQAYSLVHDDLPAMDDDDMRRGKPSLPKHSTRRRRLWPARGSPHWPSASSPRPRRKAIRSCAASQSPNSQPRPGMAGWWAVR